MGDGYFLLTNLLSEDEKRVITSITAHIERGEKRVGIQQIANENFLYIGFLELRTVIGRLVSGDSTADTLCRDLEEAAYGDGGQYII